MMTVHLTCKGCGSGINIYPDKSSSKVKCDICSHEQNLFFTEEHEQSIVHDCPECQRKDFYSQKDFNRKIGVALFIIPALMVFWNHLIGIAGFILLFIFDFFLYKKLHSIVVCYKCNAIFRKASNWKEIPAFNHEMNDRIVYADHDFKGKPLSH